MTNDAARLRPIRVGIVIPYYNHSGAIATTLTAIAKHRLPCWIVDDGSSEREREALLLAARSHAGIAVITQVRNQGKGVAVASGMRAAQSAGCTHVVTIDADNQLDADDIATLISLSQQNPNAVIAGSAVYDDSVPAARRYGRKITHFWVWLHTLSFAISDSMCGLRLYPVAAMLRVWDRDRVGRRMDFDTDILVRMYWEGTPVVQIPTRVRYPASGVSHFKMWRDNVRITWMHTKLFFGMLRRLPRILALRRLRSQVLTA